MFAERDTNDHAAPKTTAKHDQPQTGAQLRANATQPGAADQTAGAKNPFDTYDERRQFIASSPKLLQRKQKVRLARVETLDSDSDDEREAKRPTCSSRMVDFVCRKRILIPVLILSLFAAIYCVPYVEIEPRIPKRLPNIPFNFRDGPLRPSSASAFKFERLFKGQIHGAESVALDSTGNMYMAIEGGFVLYAHLNKSSPPKREYFMPPTPNPRYPELPQDLRVRMVAETPELVKIAELNGVRQIPYDRQRRRAPDAQAGGSWRRECQLDEQVYGSSLAENPNLSATSAIMSTNEVDTDPLANARKPSFVSHVKNSRCSKPLGLRLSPNENYLYIIDTLSGLYRIHLRVAERPYTSQRSVTKLIDFRTNRTQVLPVTQLELDASQQAQSPSDVSSPAVARARAYLNVSLMAVDDLVIDYGAGTRGGDLIYMTDASQNWIAVGVLYDALEGRPSGVILRFDTGNGQLSVLNPQRVAHVRTSSQDLTDLSSRLYTTFNTSLGVPYMGIGAPRLDENDVFDDRPLSFPNGIQLTDDRQALLIAESVNKRIIKHYIRGPRKGTSDLWAWTPNHPDNIRRGYDKQHETYWVVGCGHDTTGKIDLFAILNPWPRLRKFILKNMYLLGWTIELLGTHVLRSTSVMDFGYSLKTGNTACKSFCAGMMILQYNAHGDIIRSIHSKEFPNDLAYYSQADEVIDPQTQEHYLYLSSPSYDYVTKMTLPTDTFEMPASPEELLK